MTQVVLELPYGDKRWDETVASDAVDDLLTGASSLRKQFMGTKDYDRFRGQRSDCEYGFAPRHGHTVFAIGLNHEARERLNAGGELTATEIEASVNVLQRSAVGQRWISARQSLAAIETKERKLEQEMSRLRSDKERVIALIDGTESVLAGEAVS